MPRKVITPKQKIEYLSILDGDGNLDETLDPKLDSDRALYIYKLMLVARCLDERMIRVARVMNDLSACKNLGLVRKSLEPDPLSTPDALSQGLAAGTASPTRKPDPKRRVTSAPAKA
ncbi:MAG: hypothetical protein IIB61_04905 [Planctomycetes bacterium]|nr:hypothetical protein [Planctomycetota bacterium]